MEIAKLEQKALWVRQQVLQMIVGAKKGHIGGSLSCTDILIALYQGGILNIDPKKPNEINRDRFIFSKGHACEALYAVLADAGFFPSEELQKYGQAGHFLGGHIDNKIPGIEVSSGSLGHGPGIGAGLALAAKLDNKNYQTIVLVGDGECYEGSIWEAAMFAAHHKLSNLVIIVDRNKKITLDGTEDCNRLEPFASKWAAFGCEVLEIDGHNISQIQNSLKTSTNREKPLVIIAHTLKGKGVSFMESSMGWHHSVPKGDQLELARKDLGLK